ncbi:YncE family protein [Hyunsoonleella pacifica]|uniref:YncE family protein n=1 Tax=Hyunsoonleella pacifica TaxID=1080224 RepID=A0A4V2JAW6_9FLAO|nr:DUF5074 domain-containing protein [Hyunsoonleella pacifica]TBN15395.1 YncE family protein [Hyunsoonleella pacifica]GGD23698.1 hypothetical protein GCM10011368_27220 [Hyunsoonleella pacifica]
MKLNKLLVLTFSIGLFFTSCTNDDDNTPVLPRGDYENGLLISHEGNFGMGNASVSFVSFDLNTAEHNIFNNVNSELLGDTAQSIAFNGDLAYIVLNVSNKIEIVNRYTFESVTTINTGLNNPRFIAFLDGKGYVTNWGDGSNATDDYVAVIDLNTNTLEASTIAVEEGPEEVIVAGSSVYVAHQGGFSQNNKITVINGATNTVSTTITVGDVPNSLQLDNSGNLWVLCGGKPSWTGDETGGQLFKVSTADNTVTSIDFAETEHPNFLSFDDGNLYYYLAGSIYEMGSTSTTLPANAEITDLSFYNMTVNDGVLYGVDAKDFTSEGALTSYDLSTNAEVNSVTVNIIPGGIYFN